MILESQIERCVIDNSITQNSRARLINRTWSHRSARPLSSSSSNFFLPTVDVSWLITRGAGESFFQEDFFTLIHQLCAVFVERRLIWEDECAS